MGRSLQELQLGHVRQCAPGKLHHPLVAEVISTQVKVPHLPGPRRQPLEGLGAVFVRDLKLEAGADRYE